jgi:hypothetical protein
MAVKEYENYERDHKLDKNLFYPPGIEDGPSSL